MFNPPLWLSWIWAGIQNGIGWVVASWLLLAAATIVLAHFRDRHMKLRQVITVMTATAMANLAAFYVLALTDRRLPRPYDVVYGIAFGAAMLSVVVYALMLHRHKIRHPVSH